MVKFGDASDYDCISILNADNTEVSADNRAAKSENSSESSNLTDLTINDD